jgi:hypothetical protein
MFLGVYHIASVLQMKLVIVLLILGLVSATLCCSGWNKSKPCFCECEDAKADCIKRTVPALEIPLDDLIGKISTDFCDMHMLTCMKTASIAGCRNTPVLDCTSSTVFTMINLINMQSKYEIT